MTGSSSPDGQPNGDDVILRVSGPTIFDITKNFLTKTGNNSIHVVKAEVGKKTWIFAL